jgi:hypothetical protein
VFAAAKPRAERGVLVVPVIPGTTLRSVKPAGERVPASSRVLPVALALGGGLALVAGAVVLFARGSGATHDAAPASVTASTPATTPAPALVPAPHASPPLTPPHLSAEQRARAAARRLASHLPVALDSTALLRIGSKLYAVGGVSRSGSLTDAIWELDLRTGRVSPGGQFVEPLTGAASASRGGELYLAGGWTGEKLATGVLRWSPGHSSSLVTRLPSALRGASAAFVGGTLYVVSANGSEAFAVDVEAGTLTRVSKVPRALAKPPSNLEVLSEAVLAAWATG